MNEPSLYDALTRRYRLAETGCRFARMSLVAELSDAFPGETGLHRDFMQLFKQQDISQTTTGLALVYPHYVHVVVELPDPVSLPLIEWFEQQEKKNWIANATVLCCELIEKQAMPPFTSHTLSMSPTKTGEYQPSRSISGVVADVIASSVKLGRMLAPLSASQLQTTLENITFTNPDLLEPQGVFEHLVKSEELDRVAEYLTRNATMCEIHPDNELVWPLPVRLFPYD